MTSNTSNSIYKPTLSNKTYIDVSPFEKFSRNNYLCICRCREHRDTFSTLSEFKLHIGHNYHQKWLKLYDINTKFTSYRKKEDKRVNKIKILKASNSKSKMAVIDDSWCTAIFNL